MKPTQRAKIKRFLEDEVMAQTVREFIECEILKTKDNRDIHYLAAERISIDILKEAWKAMEHCRNEKVDEQATQGNIGL